MSFCLTARAERQKLLEMSSIKQEQATTEEVVALGEDAGTEQHKRKARSTGEENSKHKTRSTRHADDDDALPDVDKLGDMGDLFTNPNIDAPIKVVWAARECESVFTFACAGFE